MDRRIKEFEQGRIVYRGPNVAERMRLLSRMGLQLSEKQPDSFTSKGTLELVADIMEHLAPLIIEIDSTVNGKKISKWKDALECDELALPLQEIAIEILVDLTSSKKKASASPTAPSASSEGPQPSGPADSSQQTG